MKKIIAILTAFAMIFAFAACNKEDPKPEETTLTTAHQQENPGETTDVSATDVNGGTVDPTEGASEPVSELVSLPDDPSQWTDEQIIEFYKAAAAKTHPTARHSQTMTLDKMIVNDGDGALGFFIKMAKPIIAAVLEKNSTSFDGITGGHQDLVVTDAKSLKAYKQGNYTVIEMTMKDQIDGKHGHNMSGTVGHAITVLGDVSVAVAEFPQFKIDTDNADIKIHYNNATVKVRINQNGVIEKGTWKYIASVDIKNLDISGIVKVKTADADIGYNIVIGGGF